VLAQKIAMSKSSKSSQQARKQAPAQKTSGLDANKIIGIVVGVLALAGVIFLIRSNFVSGDPNIPGLQGYGKPQGGHSTSKQRYAQVPPVGGIHNPGWQNCGIYNNPIENEYGLHSLEHGAVWITYNPNIGPENVKKLKDLVRARAYTLLSPYPDQPSPVIASAWGFQVSTTDAADPQIGKFLERFINGPQTPEPGAPCTGSNGQPDE
jgi:hypothetical protein